mgnify:CR=1 FL=1
MVLNNGEANGRQFLSSGIIEEISRNQIEGSGNNTGLGWELAQQMYMGDHFSNRTIGKTGFTGSVIIIDMNKKIGIVILSNFTYPEREQNPDRINRFRADIADHIFTGEYFK